MQEAYTLDCAYVPAMIMVHHPKSGMAISRGHTSAKAQQSPLIQSTSMENQTHRRVTIIPQSCYCDRVCDLSPT